MERSLSGILQQGNLTGGERERTQAQITDIGTNTVSFNAYLTVFAINTVHRFPDVSSVNIDNIDVDLVRRVAEFSAVASQVALRTWENLNLEEPTTRKRRMG